MCYYIYPYKNKKDSKEISKKTLYGNCGVPPDFFNKLINLGNVDYTFNTVLETQSIVYMRGSGNSSSHSIEKWWLWKKQTIKNSVKSMVGMT